MLEAKSTPSVILIAGCSIRYWYMIGYSHFELQHPEEALEMCRKVADATFAVPETGGTRAADNRWEAIYIMGQIYHSLGQAASAIAEYTKVQERFADATEAIKFFSRKAIDLDEVTTIKPSDAKRSRTAIPQHQRGGHQGLSDRLDEIWIDAAQS